MLCIELGVVIRSRDMPEEIVTNHVFEDGMAHPITGKSEVYNFLTDNTVDP
jgi:hypothetical protein